MNRVSTYNSELQKRINARDSRMISPDHEEIGSPSSVHLDDIKRKSIGISKKENILSKVWWKYSGSRTVISNTY